MKLRERYRQLLAEGLRRDAAQEKAVAHLQRVQDGLESRPAAAAGGSQLRRWVRRLLRREAAVPGVYLWGGVGRGKTLLLDMLHEGLATPRKRRLHFHAFMRYIHGELAAVEQGDPIEHVARQLAAHTDILLLDEFFVLDIGDAMLLGRLLDQLFRRGMTLITTSNSAPRELYRDGLQRERFLPAIAALEHHTEVVELDGATDYRRSLLVQDSGYHYPLDARTEEELRLRFRSLVPAGVLREDWVEVSGRRLQVRAQGGDIVWFDFRELCAQPCGSADYLELAQRFHTVFISGVPALSGKDDQARRFIHLVDSFYDHKVKLVLSAEQPPPRLYTKGALGRDFRRTISRLDEMFGVQYLADAHRP